MYTKLFVIYDSQVVIVSQRWNNLFLRELYSFFSLEERPEKHYL